MTCEAYVRDLFDYGEVSTEKNQHKDRKNAQRMISYNPVTRSVVLHPSIHMNIYYAIYYPLCNKVANEQTIHLMEGGYSRSKTAVTPVVPIYMPFKNPIAVQ